ncbi:MAG: UDP-N-acetylglucosamine 2-epimerase (non-hydrolyzing) [Actinobacteria bacterium]|nr:UDP-N-acetylglucosamine 2-epimerase (non-hydrolyzing) [Actinomycetota bacterium]
MNLHPSASGESTEPTSPETAARPAPPYPAKDRTDGATLSIPVVVGTRPEAIKLLPVILALRAAASFTPVVVSTGQHHKMVKGLYDRAGIEIETNLWAGGDRAELNERVPTVMQRFNDFIHDFYGGRPDDRDFEDAILNGHYPAAVLVHGDTSSAMAAALASFHKHIPVMHVEAGLRTGGTILSPFPEELNRQVITCVAAMHFAPTFPNLQALVRENVPIGQIFVTGNTGIDALRWAAELQTPYADRALQSLHDSEARIVVATAHRRENWGDGLGRIAAGLRRLAERNPSINIVVPLHPNPRVRDELGEPLRDLANVLLTEALEYTAFARLLARSELVITDSGGIQEEAPSLDKPVLVMRETTERNEGLSAGTLQLVGTDPARIASAAERLLGDPVAYLQMASADNPYGDGHAAARIVAAMEHLLHGGTEPAPFGAGYDRAEVAAMAGFKLAGHTSGNALELAQYDDSRKPDRAEVWPT